MATATRKTPSKTAGKAPARKAAAPTTASPKPAAKAATPAPAKPKSPQAAAPAAKPAKVDKTAKAEKDRKPKLVRDSFTIPKAEYAALADLKQRAATLGHPVKKSELLRAGIMALAALADNALVASLAAVPAVKTGRPPKD